MISDERAKWFSKILPLLILPDSFIVGGLRPTPKSPSVLKMYQIPFALRIKSPKVPNLDFAVCEKAWTEG